MTPDQLERFENLRVRNKELRVQFDSLVLNGGTNEQWTEFTTKNVELLNAFIYFLAEITERSKI